MKKPGLDLSKALGFGVLWMWLGMYPVLHADTVILSSSQDSLRCAIDSLRAEVQTDVNLALDIRTLDDSVFAYRYRAENRQVPASVQKIILSAAVLEAYGPTYRFRTDVGTNGEVRKHTLRGDLVIKASGDPTFSGHFHSEGNSAFEDWAALLLAQDIHKITGDIVVIDTLGYRELAGPGWSWEDIVWDYGSFPTGFSAQENRLLLKINGGERTGDKAVIAVTQPLYGCRFINEIVTSAAVPRNSIDIIRTDDPHQWVVRGVIRPNESDIEGVALPDPEAYAGLLLAETLQNSGIRFHGSIRIVHHWDGQKDDPWHILFTYESPVVTEILTVMNKRSVNFLAEMMYQSLEHDATHGLAWRQLMTGWGCPMDSLVMVDGSGLSRYDLATAEQLTEILVQVGKRSCFDAFRTSLPIAGVDGTLKKRMIGTSAEGKVYAKTGSMKHIRNLSGYVQTRRDHWIAFTMMCSDFTDDGLVKRFQDRLCQLLAESDL